MYAKKPCTLSLENTRVSLLHANVRDATGTNLTIKTEGMWGTLLAAKLRARLSTGLKRPLVWADSSTSAMLIDPIVGGIAGDRITAGDIALFRKWKLADGFAQLAARAAKHLHLYHLTWKNRQVCEVSHVPCGCNRVLVG